MLGDLTHVHKMLRSQVGADFAGDPNDRLAEIQKAVSAALESKLGRAFGAVGGSEQVVIDPPGTSALLLLPKGNRTVTSVIEGATWDGDTLTWLPGSTLSKDSYRRVYLDRNSDALALYRVSGSLWGTGPVLVTGTWGDVDSDTAVPDAINYAANYLIAEQYKIEQAGPAGFTGPDGSVMPIRNPWKHELVKQAISQFSIRQGRVVI